MTLWWEYKSARVPPRASIVRQPIRPPEPEPEEGEWYKKGLKTVTSPLRKAGAFALDKLGDYNRRFVTPSAAWATENLMEFDEATGSYKLMIGRLDNPIDFLQHPIQKQRRTLFGNKIPESTAINPLKAYNGDDNEIERAEKYMSQFDPLTRFVLEGVFDPTVILTTGSAMGARGLISLGAKNLSKSKAELDVLKAALGQRGALKTIMGEHDDMFRWLREHPGDNMSKAMLGTGTIMNVLNGLPETMLDTFFKMAAKPISKVPALRMTIQETEHGIRLKPTLDFESTLAQQSPRSKVEMSIQASHQLVETTKRAVMMENPSLDMLDINQEIMRRIADPKTDFSGVGGFAEEAHKVIHESGVYMDDLVERASPLINDHRAFLEKDLQERIAGAFMSKYKLAGKALDPEEIKRLGKLGGMTDETIAALVETGAKDVDLLPNWQKIAAKGLNLEKGHKFFRNKLAATWMSGVLMSPFYLVQNLVTDPLFSGFKYTSSPEAFRLEFARSPHTIINHLANRGGLARRMEMTGQDIDDVYKMMRDGEIFGQEVGQMGQPMANAFLKTQNKYTGGGYVMENYDKLINYGQRVGLYGDGTRNALHGFPLIPQQGASMADDRFWLGVYGSAIKKKYNEGLLFHPNPRINKMVAESEQIGYDLQQMGVPKAQADIFSRRYLTSTSVEELKEGARAISGLKPSDLIHIDQYSDNLLFSRDITKRVQDAVNNHYGFTREQLISGRTITLKDGTSQRIEGLDEIFRVGLRDEQVKTMQWAWRAFPAKIDNLIDDAELSPAMNDYLRSINSSYTESMQRLDDYGVKILTHPKSSARDVRVWGDINLRNLNARQQLAHVVKDAIDGAGDGSFRVNWKNKQRISLAVRDAGDNMSGLMDDFAKARKQGLAKITDTSIDRKAWGDFRAKYDIDNVLPETPDIDALDNFIKTKQDEVWSDHFDEVRGILGVQGNTMRFENRTFEGYNQILQRYTRDVMELTDNQAARQSTLMAYVNGMENLPHVDPEIGAELARMQDISSRYGVDLANEQMGAFYNGTTNLDETLQWALPFARFGVRVATAGPRVIARNPELAPMFYRWQHGSEKVQSPIPSWMPMVGNLWFNPMGAMAPYQQFQAMTNPRTFGEDFGQQLTSEIGKMGFSPSPLLAAGMNIAGNEESFGPLFPGQKAIRGLGQTLGPAGIPFEGADLIMNKIRAAVYGGPEEDISLTREVERQLVDNGLNPATTPRDSDEWANAKREVIRRQAGEFMFGAGIVREFPKERIEMAQTEAKAIAAAGISTDMQAALRKEGKSAYSMLNGEQRDKVIAQIGEENFNNRAAITPAGLTTTERNRWHATQTYYAIRNVSEQQRDDNIRAIGQQLLDGEIDGNRYRELRGQEYANHTAVTDMQRRSVLAELYGDDILDANKFDEDKVFELFEKMRTDTRRAAGRNVDSTRLPEDEALDQFRSINPDKDSITGEIDWAEWDNKKQSFLLSQPPSIQSYIEKIEERRTTRDPVEAKFAEAKQQYDAQQQIPRYLGMGPEEQLIARDGLKVLRGLQDRGYERKRALVLLQQASPQMAILTRIALRSPNPAYRKFRENHPLIQLFFSDSAIPSDVLPTKL